MKRMMVLLVALLLLLVVMIAPASAGGQGAIQISGFADLEPEGCERTDITYDYLFALIDGDLEGCVYVTIDLENTGCSRSGTYRETGTEYYVITGGELDLIGTFQTSYRFTGKFENCPPADPPVEIFGRCQHPVVSGSDLNSGAFEFATGRLDFKDDLSVDPPEFPYRGHMRGLVFPDSE